MSELKYAPGRGPRRTNAGRPLSTIEQVTVAHLMGFVALSSWYFGGCSDTARVVLSWWGTIGAAILVIAIADKGNRKGINLQRLRWLWPFAAFNVVVVLSTLIPNMRTLDFGADVGFIKLEGVSKWLPSAAFADEALKGLWLFDAIYISAFTAVVTIAQRRSIRLLLGFAAVNTSILAVFGTLQKLGHAKGLYFGAVASPQPNFFASFIYDNHWGAYVVVTGAMLLGLTMRVLRRSSTHEFLHSPGLMGLIALVLVSVSIPLSNSRSCTILIAILLGYAFASWMWSTLKRRRQNKESVGALLICAAAAVVLTLGATWYVAGESILSRLATTRSQLAVMRSTGSIGSRHILYDDTWSMAKDMPVFGWGTNSYPHVFMLYNTQESKADDLPVFYHDAHCDYLQSLAEHGFVGTILLGLCAIVPLLSLLRARAPGPLPGYLLVGCGLILAYAAVEFPFGNPAVVLAWWLGLFCAVHYTLLDKSAR